MIYHMRSTFKLNLNNFPIGSQFSLPRRDLIRVQRAPDLIIKVIIMLAIERDCIFVL